MRVVCCELYVVGSEKLLITFNTQLTTILNQIYNYSLPYGKNTKLAPSGTITNTHINSCGFL
jgi:hypothetical protein